LTSTVRGLRALRTWAVATAAAGVSALAHAAAGGGLPDLFTLAVACVVVAAVAMWLGRVRRGPLVLAAALGATQAGLHGWFTLAGAACALGPPPAAGGAHAADATAHAPAGAGVDVVCAAGHHAGAAAGSGAGGWSMLVLHAVAVLATAGLAAVGEHGVRGLLLWLAPLLRLPVAGALAQPTGPRGGAFVDTATVVDALGVLRCAVSRRGPPALSRPRKASPARLHGAVPARRCLA
jgi:hypothetical protein